VFNIRIVVGRGNLGNVHNVDLGGRYTISGITPESLTYAIEQYLGIESPSSIQSRTYSCEKPDGIGIRVHIRGSDTEPKGQVCQGRA